MLDIVLMLFFFAASVIAHVYYCRKTRQAGLHAKAFVGGSLVFLCVYVALVMGLSGWGIENPHSAWGAPLMITASLIYILLVPIYLCFYVLTQLTSPSKRILVAVSGQEGVSYNALLAQLQQEDFIATRLNDLLASGCVLLREGRYVLTPEGQKIAMVLQVMQALLGRDAGG